MNVSVANSNRTWAGLLIEAPGHTADENNLREILGNDAVVLVVRGTDAAIDSVRKIVGSRSSCILTEAGSGLLPELTPLLNIAASLSSLRRIVVLHDASVEPDQSMLRRGVLMLRDCPEVRSALTALVAKEMGTGLEAGMRVNAGQSQSARCDESDTQIEPSHALAFEACVRVAAPEPAQSRGESARPAEPVKQATNIGHDEPPWHFRSVLA
jgi:hypothetical protein